jgi:hypothetical protein
MSSIAVDSPIHVYSCCCFSLRYLKSVAGYRTVPVELGSRYTDEEWSQKLMTVSEFVDNHVIPDSMVSRRWGSESPSQEWIGNYSLVISEFRKLAP